MPITPYDKAFYLLMPFFAAMMAIRWARRTPEWSWPVLVTHQIVLSALYFVLYLGIWIILIFGFGGWYSLITLLALPLLIVVWHYRKARRLASVDPTSSHKAIQAGLGAACVAYVAYAAYQYRTMMHAENEAAAATGYSDFLLIAPLVLVGSFALGWSAMLLHDTVRKTTSSEPDGR
jgi:hypothetical protein